MELKTLIEHTVKSVYYSNIEKSNIDPNILNIDGMSSKKIRHLINNLCSLSDASYFEVGSWKGSTLCSAISNNNLSKVTSCENFSEFTDDGHKKINLTIKDQLLNNIQNFKGSNNVEIIEEDFFSKQWGSDKKYNIYLYDGAHSIQTQYFQIKIAKQFLDKYSIMLVDDWSCEISKPKQATFKALNDFGMHVHLYIDLPIGHEDEYWCGQGLFVLENL